jgi:putative ABC transport system permease protein
MTSSNTASAPVQYAPAATFFVAGVWRDYARQFGSITIDKRDFERLTGDTPRQRPGHLAGTGH